MATSAISAEEFVATKRSKYCNISLQFIRCGHDFASK